MAACTRSTARIKAAIRYAVNNQTPAIVRELGMGTHQTDESWGNVERVGSKPPFQPTESFVMQIRLNDERRRH